MNLEQSKRFKELLMKNSIQEWLEACKLNGDLEDGVLDESVKIVNEIPGQVLMVNAD